MSVAERSVAFERGVEGREFVGDRTARCSGTRRGGCVGTIQIRWPVGGWPAHEAWRSGARWDSARGATAGACCAGPGRRGYDIGGAAITPHIPGRNMDHSENVDFRTLVPLLDALNCGAGLVRRGGTIVHANPRLAEMLGRTPRELIGLDIRALYHDEEGQRRLEELEARFDEAYEIEFHLPGRDRNPIPVVLSGRPVHDGTGGPGHKLITVIDITPQKEAEERANARYREISKLSDTVIEQALDLKHYNRELEDRVRARTAELHMANMDAIYMLAVASEAKDADTGAHVRRIQQLARSLGQRVGLDAYASDELGYSAILHDVGKMIVPDHILKKPGPLTDDERELMEQHTVAGERILAQSDFFRTARLIARSHHENWDGSGYPDRIGGEEIPLAARIVHVVDVYDALVNSRVYKPAWSAEAALEELRRLAGQAFDPELVEPFGEVIAENGESS